MSRVQTSVLVLAIMLTAIAGALLSSGRAAAVPTDLGWGSPVPLVNHIAGDALSPSVGMDPSGNAIAFWYHSTGQRSLPSGNLFVQGGSSWQVPTILDWANGGTPGFQSSVAMDGAGNAIAVWSVYWTIWAARYTPGGGWGPAQQIGYCCTPSIAPVVAMNPSGVGFVAWYQWDGTQYSIFGVRYDPATGWGAPSWVESNDVGYAANPHVGVDDSGNAIVVWNEWDGTSLYRIAANRYDAGTGWETAVYISPAGIYAYSPDIAVNRNGTALAVYADVGPAIRWLPYAPGPGWGAVGTISAVGFSENNPRIASNADTGEAVVAWLRGEASGQNLYTSNYFPPPGAGWSAPFLREGWAPAASNPVVAMNRGGIAILAWQQSDGAVSQIYAWWYRSGSGWTGIYTLSSGLTGDKSAPAVAMSDFGTGWVVYQQKDPTRYNVRSSRFTGAGFSGSYAVEFDNAGGASDARVAANAAGQAATAWWQFDGVAWNMYAATYHPASGWSRPTLLENVDRGNAVDASVAIDEAGNAFVIWVQWDVHWNLWAARYASGLGWSTPYPMESLDGDAGLPQVAFDSQGNAVAVWYQHDGTAFSIYGSTWTPTAGWTVPATIETSDYDAYEPHLVIAPDDSALVAWHQYDGTYDSIYYGTYTPGVGWSMPALAESLAAWSRWVRLAMNDAGQAILIWHVWNGVAYDLWANEWTGSAWTGEALIENDPGWIDWPVIAIDGQGNGVAAWYAFDGMEYNVFRVEYRNGAWLPERLVTTSAGDSVYPSVTADRYGNMMVAWSQWDGSNWGVHAQRYIAGAGWSDTAQMAQGGEAAWLPRLAVDGAGDVFSVYQQYDGERWIPWVNKYTIGDGAPRLDLTGPTPGLTNDPVVVVSGVTDPGASVTIDGSSVAVDSTGYFSLMTILLDGPRTFRVVATNLAGNSRMVTVSVTVDTTAPLLVIATPADGSLTNVPNAWVSGITEPGATVDVDGIQATVDAGGRFGLTEGMAEGTNTFVVTATDAAGNSRSSTVRVTLDTIAPALDLTMPAAQVTNMANVVVSGTTEPGASVTVDGTPAPVGPTGLFSTTVTLPEGAHTFTVVARDAAGNTATRTAQVTVDTTAPNVAITDPTNGLLTRSSLVSVYGTADPDARVAVNGVQVENSGGNFFARIALSEGLQVIRADAVDPAGNVATTQVTVTVDLTPPQLAIGSPADGSITNNPNVLVSGITEPGSTVLVDGAAVTVGPSGVFSTTVALPDGPHVFDVRSTDPAGNTAQVAASVTVDTAPPLVSITSPASGTVTSQPTVSVSGTAEVGATLVVNGYAVSVGATGTFSIRLALQPGPNAITATATDAAGNTATDSVSVTYTDPMPGLRQQLNDTNDELNNTKDRLDATLQALGNTQASLNATRSDLATANANLASLGTETFILLVLVIISIALAAIQFLMLRRMRGSPAPPKEPEAPPPST